MDWQRRRKLDFWLLAGMVGLWVYWLFLYRPRLLTLSALKSYFEMVWQNKVPVLLFSAAGFVALFCFRKKKRSLGIIVFLLALGAGYWAYGPDFPKVPPLDPPKVLWKQLPSKIPVMLAISYNYLGKLRGEFPPQSFAVLGYWLALYGVQVTGETASNLQEQSKKILRELAQKAGEDDEFLSKCLSLATLHLPATELESYLPLIAEKRYDRLTGQLSWYFGFVRLRQERNGLILLGLSPVQWVAVRFRFPQKARLLGSDYSNAGSSGTFISFLKTLLVIAGYVVFLKVLRYAFDRWF